ncbi:hypothetical protein TNIN_370921 [Trichonephila inaurata madagascariensis]|uniref:Uncharacterized protein n=1 Tax=Trichonephila inaurata madagascariensis TaxID=2747483 RepID=A0A8X6MGE3_9ARAC|nr:hypothetical protein TNIN_370921 [Trichonephila inaurata madagascariensis]
METRYTQRTSQRQTVMVSSFESRHEESSFGQMEKRRAKKVVARSISLNFNTAHALNLRLRRGHALLSPLHLRQHDFRQVSQTSTYLLNISNVINSFGPLPNT